MGFSASRLLKRWRVRRSSEAGIATILVAIVVPLVGIGCAATAVDVGRWYLEVQRVQKAADASALAGVPYLPHDMPNAVLLAKEVAARNGYNDTAADVIVVVAAGDKTTQLRVTITKVVHNVFGSAIGVPQTTITRSAVGDFLGPSPMGSPCNTFANEPNAGNRAVVTPVLTAQSASPPAGCVRSPQYWATVFGPQTDKASGDRYQTKGCSAGTGVDGCNSSNNNLEYDEFGYVFVVKVAEEAKDTEINLQVYDPMYVETGSTCGLLPSWNGASSTTGDFLVNNTTNQNLNVNPWVQNKDAVNRYTDNGAYTGLYAGDKAHNYCSGDNNPSSFTSATTTSFVLRQQTDSQNPKLAPVQNSSAGAPCIKQYGTHNATGANISANLFKSSGGATYNAEVAEQFHNWVSLCKFTPTRSGDYYLQVRTNVSMGGSGGTLIRSGNTDAAALTGNTTSGGGENMFALRAVTNAGKENFVAVSGYNHMPIFVNTLGGTTPFHLIRVLPGAAGQKISFSYFDAGDSTGTGEVTVQRPPDATGSITTTPFPGGCTAYGGSAGGSVSSQTTLTNCVAPFDKLPPPSTSSKNNGRVETITIPIPSDYTCSYLDYAGCWYRVTVSFGGDSVTDVTTWDATVIADPVRLIE